MRLNRQIAGRPRPARAAKVAWLWIVALSLAASGGGARAQLRLGADVLAEQSFAGLRGKRVGLITNPTGVNRQGQSTIDALLGASDVKLVALFGPEHGLYGNAAAGDRVADTLDSRTGLPVHSLYGKTRKPTPEMLRDLDALVYDVQDIGCRSYTFISTMGLAMEACAERGIEFVVLDRPNPLGGVRVEGPSLDPKFRSFVGQWPVPYVYGLTCGELARMINQEAWIAKPCKLTVIPMAGWRRDMSWADTGLVWTPTSPKIPTAESALYYASTGILGELGGVNIGGNFKMSFQCVTTPWMDERKAFLQFNSYGLPGVYFAPFTTNVNRSPQRGVHILFTNAITAPLVAINFYAIDAVRKMSGRNLVSEAVQAHRDFSMFDKVTGTDRIRKALLSGASAASIVKSWRRDEENFRALRKKYLLY
jgi:uncharacterized protein YbbC (DUF1343 family)